MLHALVAAPAHPEERNHPIRLFVGSGMPASLWRRVKHRFDGANVLELYASMRTDAILGNVSDRKAGALGRPMPGTPRVEVVQVDPATGRPRTDESGYAVACDVDETGLLLVEARRETHGRNEVALRGLFSADDAWIASGALFRRDADGDLWLVDSLAALITARHGTVSPRTVEDALGEFDAVDLAACHPVTDSTSGATLAVASVTLRPGRTLDAEALDHAFRRLERAGRPDLVHVIDAMPMTSWYRPALSELQSAGVPTAGHGAEVWRLRRQSGRYRRIADNTPTETTRRGS
jgi:putative long chain acyl-CoA synthase